MGQENNKRTLPSASWFVRVDFVFDASFFLFDGWLPVRAQELDSMQDEEGWEAAVTTLAKAQKAIDLGVACQPEPEEETELTVLCLGHTATDIHQVR